MIISEHIASVNSSNATSLQTKIQGHDIYIQITEESDVAKLWYQLELVQLIWINQYIQ